VAIGLPDTSGGNVTRAFTFGRELVPLVWLTNFELVRSIARRALPCGLRRFLAARLVLAIAFPLGAQNSVSPEYRSKATFLAAFATFVEWPDDAFSSAQAPVLVCVRGDFVFGTTLAEIARTASPHGRRIEVRWVHKDEELRACHIAFISRSESKRYAKLLQAVLGAEVLTVGETPDFLGAGGAMSFAIQQDELHFEVNLAAAAGARLKISSRLLALAVRVAQR